MSNTQHPLYFPLRTACITLLAFILLHCQTGDATQSTITKPEETATPTEHQHTWSDERIKSNVHTLSSEMMLDVISKLRVVDFDYDHEQFYNKLFGKTNTGFIAQEVNKVFPRAVGVVKNRKLPQPDGSVTILEDLHVLNQDSIYVTNIGATQELIKRTSTLQQTVSQMESSVAETTTSTGALSAAMTAELKSVRDDQQSLQTLASAAHSKGELALNQVEGVSKEQAKLAAEQQANERVIADRLSEVKKDASETMNKAVERLNARVEEAEAQVRLELANGLQLAMETGKLINSTTTKVNELHSTTELVSAQVAKLKTHMENAMHKVETTQTGFDVKLMNLEERSTITSTLIDTNHGLHLTFKSEVHDSLMQLQNKDDAASAALSAVKSDTLLAITQTQNALDEFKVNSTSSNVRMTMRIENVEKKLGETQGDLSKAIEKFQEDSIKSLENSKKFTTESTTALEVLMKADLQHLATDFKAADKELENEVSTLEQLVEQLKIQIERQAIAEVVEKRKLAEANAQEAQAKVELEKVKAAEQRATAEHMDELERQRDIRLNQTSYVRVQQEEGLREARELSVLKANEESNARKLDQEKEMRIAVAVAEAEAQMGKARLEQETTLQSIRVQSQETAEQERKNKDVRAEMLRVQAEEDRKRLVEGIRAGAEEATRMVVWLGANPQYLGAAIGAVVAIVACAFLAKELASVVRRRIEQTMGRPSLVRESSRGSWIIEFTTRFLPISLVSHLFELCMSTYSFICMGVVGMFVKHSGKINSHKNKAESKGRMATKGRTDLPMDAAFNGVILAPRTFDQVSRICFSTFTAHARGAPLRNVMFYGPPGTGKTMVAKRMAKLCGLDYAIMSGADVAPLQEQAVTEIHALFSWAKTTRRGVLLFVDEADAFLCSRSKTRLSETAKNALTALLYHTGSAESKVMLVLATNRPQDLDSAVIDRVDESVHFFKPGMEERVQLVKYYFGLHVRDLSVQTFEERVQAARKQRWMVMGCPLSRLPRRPKALIRVQGVDDKALANVAAMLEDFSGREIAKLLVTMQAHAFASCGGNVTIGGHGDAYLDRASVDQLAKDTVERHAAVQGYGADELLRGGNSK